MRRTAIAVLLLAASLVVAVARAAPLQRESLSVAFDARIAPSSLPRERLAPLRLTLSGKIGTSDGTRPPALSELSVAFNRGGRLSLRGLPNCAPSRIQQTTTEAALAACREALVGHGSFGANVDFQGAPTIPAHGKVLIFNARIHGRPSLLLHLYGSSPVRAAFVLPFTVSHLHHGTYGVSLTARIPTLASGLGYVTELQLTIGRHYDFAGRRRSVLSASCALPRGFTVLPIDVAKARFSFDDGREVTGHVAHPCRVRQ
jgi:hypothetical protein